MTRSEIFKELKTLSDRIFNLECKLSDYIQSVHSQSSDSIEEIKNDIMMIKQHLELEIEEKGDKGES